MTVSLILTEQIVKLFIILIIGFIMVRIGLLKVSDSKSIFPSCLCIWCFPV